MFKDFDKAQNTTPLQNPMPILNMALIPTQVCLSPVFIYYKGYIHGSEGSGISGPFSESLLEAIEPWPLNPILQAAQARM